MEKNTCDKDVYGLVGTMRALYG